MLQQQRAATGCGTLLNPSKALRQVFFNVLILVGKGGIEPPLPCENQILSLARLPIPPLAQKYQYTYCIYELSEVDSGCYQCIVQ